MLLMLLLEGGLMKQAKVLNDKEMERVLKIISTKKHAQRNRLIFFLSFYAGMRACEIANIRVFDVIDKEGYIQDVAYLTADQVKGKESQCVYLSEKVKKEIQKYVREVHFRGFTENTKLIKSQRGGGFNSATIQQVFRVLYEEAGITNASSHSGRRHFITNLSDKGVSTRVIQELARHKSLVTTQKYIDVSSDKLLNAVGIL